MNTFRSFFIFNEANTLVVKFCGLFVFTFFEGLISLIFGFCGFGQFLLFAQLPFFLLFMLEIQKFDFEVQGGIWWDSWGWASLSIGILWSTDERSSFTFFHGGESFIPSLNNSSLTQIKFKRTVPILVRIKFRPIF